MEMGWPRFEKIKLTRFVVRGQKKKKKFHEDFSRFRSSTAIEKQVTNT
jgi:hypothetical protein